MPPGLLLLESQRAGDLSDTGAGSASPLGAARAKQLNLELDDAANQVLSTVMKVTCWRWLRHWSVYRCLARRQIDITAR